MSFALTISCVVITRHNVVPSCCLPVSSNSFFIHFASYFVTYKTISRLRNISSATVSQDNGKEVRFERKLSFQNPFWVKCEAYTLRLTECCLSFHSRNQIAQRWRRRDLINPKTCHQERLIQINEMRSADSTSFRCQRICTTSGISARSSTLTVHVVNLSHVVEEKLYFCFSLWILWAKSTSLICFYYSA